MQRALRTIRQSSFALFLIALVAGLPSIIHVRGSNAAAAAPTAQTRTRPLPVANSHAFITYKAEGKVGCRDATTDEASALRRRSGQSLHGCRTGRVYPQQPAPSPSPTFHRRARTI